MDWVQCAILTSDWQVLWAESYVTSVFPIFWCILEFAIACFEKYGQSFMACGTLSAIMFGFLPVFWANATWAGFVSAFMSVSRVSEPWWWPTLFLSWWCCSHWIDVTCSCAMIVSIDFAGVWRQSCQMPVEFFDATCPDLRCFFRSVMPDVRCQTLSCFMPDWSKDFFQNWHFEKSNGFREGFTAVPICC